MATIFFWGGWSTGRLCKIITNCTYLVSRESSLASEDDSSEFPLPLPAGVGVTGADADLEVVVTQSLIQVSLYCMTGILITISELVRKVQFFALVWWHYRFRNKVSVVNQLLYMIFHVFRYTVGRNSIIVNDITDR